MQYYREDTKTCPRVADILVAVMDNNNQVKYKVFLNVINAMMKNEPEKRGYSAWSQGGGHCSD